MKSILDTREHRSVLDVKKVREKGRFGDEAIAHLTPGEIVIPRALAEDDGFRSIVAHFMRENGADPERFIVGSGKNRTNPQTGYMEFGWNPFGSIAKIFRNPVRIVTHPKETLFEGSLTHEAQKAAKRAGTMPQMREVELPAPPELPPTSPTPTKQIQEAKTQVRRRGRGREATILAGRRMTLGAPRKSLGA